MVPSPCARVPVAAHEDLLVRRSLLGRRGTMDIDRSWIAVGVATRYTDGNWQQANALGTTANRIII